MLAAKLRKKDQEMNVLSEKLESQIATATDATAEMEKQRQEVQQLRKSQQFYAGEVQRFSSYSRKINRAQKQNKQLEKNGKVKPEY